MFENDYVWGKIWYLPKGQKSREQSKAKESSKFIENHNAESKSFNTVDP